MGQWVKRWNITMAIRPTLPGVWRRKEGGFVVRARTRDGRTGKQVEILKVLIDISRPEEALTWLQNEKRRVRMGEPREARPIPRFFDYAVLLLERKITTNEIKSAKTRQRWGYMLQHHLKPAFGDYFVDKISRSDVEAWRARIGAAIQAGMSPHSANGILATLTVIINAATDEFGLPQNPVKGVKPFPTSTRPTYTAEEPNALTAEELGVFLATMEEKFPQHHAMVLLGFVTGLRPSSMRPLRRVGPNADVRWNEGIIHARRSHTVGEEVMETTKTGIEYRIALPASVVDVLRAHAARLPAVAAASELLFPTDTGGYRSPSCLDKPFAVVTATLGLKKRITPRAMRRTYQDLARQAQVNDVVTRAISGHATESMQHHYSTVGDAEKREAVAKIYSLVERRGGGQSGGQVDGTRKAGGT